MRSPPPPSQQGTRRGSGPDDSSGRPRAAQPLGPGRERGRAVRPPRGPGLSPCWMEAARGRDRDPGPGDGAEAAPAASTLPSPRPGDKAGAVPAGGERRTVPRRAGECAWPRPRPLRAGRGAAGCSVPPPAPPAGPQQRGSHEPPSSRPAGPPHAGPGPPYLPSRRYPMKEQHPIQLKFLLRAAASVPVAFCQGTRSGVRDDSLRDDCVQRGLKYCYLMGEEGCGSSSLLLCSQPFPGRGVTALGHAG